MPVIVMTGEDTFKFINDGRPQQGSENYTYYASKEQAPEEIKALMNKPLDPSRDYREQTAGPAAAPTAASATSNVAPRAGPPAVPRGATPRQGIGQVLGGAQGRYDPQTGTIKPSTANIAPRAGVPAVPGARGATPATLPTSAGAAAPGGPWSTAPKENVPWSTATKGVMPQPWLTQGGAPEPAPADLWRRLGGGAPEPKQAAGSSVLDQTRPTYDQSYVAPPSPVGQFARPPGYDTSSAGSLYSPPSGPMGSPGQQFDTARLNPPREGESIPPWMQPPPGQMGVAGGGGSSGFGAAPQMPSYSGYGNFSPPPQNNLGIQNFQIPTAAEGAAPPMAQILPAPVQQMQQIQGFQPPSFPGGQSAMSNPNYPYNPNWRR